MADRFLDFSGLRCPLPILKLSSLYSQLKQGEVIDIVSDCPTFEKDIKAWCLKLGKTILNIERFGNKIKVTIRI
ncbi:MAG TPA: sulfurtransferase TusA family protein [Thermodesulfovibrio thiophilus]|uniref:sulfurtransferase TusA family protein n=1 Tax=Thermodesulfovibrio thiophilus TaxID=340095 RepID=UPI00040EEBB8|nr:sulfurtransferase TusA family protein [Thermodesulfovibrio thiophilus]HHW20454.1 SirA-like protein [Thermodesulfovibrio thiophilus]HQD36396.1 sulfurtransferase TusA family protein [Thermodesulfovibrio thiophilus]